MRRFLLAASVLTLLAPAGALAAPRGAVHQLHGRGSCLGAASGCASLRGVRTVEDVAVSPNGRTVYVAGTPNALAVLRRNRRTGRIRQLAGRAGCLRRAGGAGCATAPDLQRPGELTFNRNGGSVYAAGTGGIAAFARRAKNGALRPLTGGGACDAGHPCRPDGRTFSFSTPVVSRDGRTVYIERALGGPVPASITILRRNPNTGRLHQPAGAAGCLSSHAGDGCATTTCLDDEAVLGLSPDGDDLYAATSDSTDIESTSDGHMATFSGAADGSPALAGCVHTRHALSDMVVSPRGSVYVSWLFGDRGTGIAGAGLDRWTPSGTGVLRRHHAVACFDGGRCAAGNGADNTTLALVPSRRALYVSFFDGGLFGLRTSPGRLKRIPRPGGCLVNRALDDPRTGCARPRFPFGLPVSAAPDGRTLYIVAGARDRTVAAIGIAR